jgi:hypothetical protein
VRRESEEVTHRADPTGSAFFCVLIRTTSVTCNIHGSRTACNKINSAWLESCDRYLTVRQRGSQGRLGTLLVSCPTPSVVTAGVCGSEVVWVVGATVTERSAVLDRDARSVIHTSADRKLRFTDRDARAADHARDARARARTRAYPPQYPPRDALVLRVVSAPLARQALTRLDLFANYAQTTLLGSWLAAFSARFLQIMAPDYGFKLWLMR